MRRYVLLPALIALAIAFGACGGGKSNNNASGTRQPTSQNVSTANLTPVPGNSELDVGPNRFALALIGKDNRAILEAPGTTVHLAFSGPGGSSFEQDAAFVWAIQNSNGFWTANVNFAKAGQWQVKTTVTVGGQASSVIANFPVREKSVVPNIGDPAPPADNLTLVTEPNIKRVSTDETPNNAFYQLTVTEALQQAKPFVVVFATPKFCQTRFCGPVLNNVKAIQAAYADRVNFIHIEPYELAADGSLASGSGAPVPAAPTLAWKLQTEPWVFVVKADGTIAARFEGAASSDELRAALDQALTPG